MGGAAPATRSGPRRRTREQGDRSRERILDAAERLFSERGFAGTSISAICRRSGLPVSSVYWHFGSKDGLLAAVAERAAMRIVAELGAAAEVPGDPEVRLRRLLRRGATLLERRPPDFVRLQMMLALERRSGDDAWQRAASRVRARLERLLEDALAAAFAAAGRCESRRVARRCAEFAAIFSDGVLIAAEREPGRLSPRRLARELETALLALGNRLLAERRGARAALGRAP